MAVIKLIAFKETLDKLFAIESKYVDVSFYILADGSSELFVNEEYIATTHTRILRRFAEKVLETVPKSED